MLIWVSAAIGAVGGFANGRLFGRRQVLARLCREIALGADVLRMIKNNRDGRKFAGDEVTVTSKLTVAVDGQRWNLSLVKAEAPAGDE